MVVSNQLKKQIIIEIFALIFLIAVIIYAVFALEKNNQNKITSQDGFVLVLDDSKFKPLKNSSDGEGLDTEGITYTITNNNTKELSYYVVLVPNIKDKKVLEQVRVSNDDIIIEDLTSLNKKSGGYVVATNSLGAGYTKIHLFKFWYKLDTPKDLLESNIEFSFKVVIE